jgi:sugar lactone lactonase YvrE
MTASLKCPTCSAPLDAPAGHVRTMKCPYCGATAVLTERLGHVEATAAPDAHTGDIAEVVRLLREGRTIEAIKVYRERFGIGLKEAKDAVDRIAAGQPAGSVPASALKPVAGGLGCVLTAIVVVTVAAGLIFSRIASDTDAGDPPTPPLPNIPLPSFPTPDGEDDAEANALAREVLRFGREGTGAGGFEDARSVAVDGAGRVYVAEYSGGRVQVFDSLGRFQTQWMADERMPLLDLAADREGTVYVAQSGRIRRYEGATGTLRDEIRPRTPRGGYDDVTVALDGTLWAVAGDGHLVHLGRDGRVLETVDVRAALGEAADPTRVAVSGTGHLYALDRWTAEVYHFDPDGRFVDRFGGQGDRPENLQSPSDLAYDGRGRLLVADLGGGLRLFDPEGHFLGAVGPEAVVFGLALTDADEVYATYRNDHQVAKYRLTR